MLGDMQCGRAHPAFKIVPIITRHPSLLHDIFVCSYFVDSYPSIKNQHYEITIATGAFITIVEFHAQVVPFPDLFRTVAADLYLRPFYRITVVAFFSQQWGDFSHVRTRG